MITLVLSIHIAAIVIWSAGLVGMPGLYVQRTYLSNENTSGRTDDEWVHRLHRLVRFAYVGVLSPAAFIAVASGIVLVFLREVFEPWFSLKLAFVGVLVLVHTLSGMTLIRLFNDGEGYPVWRFLLATSISLFVVGVILVLVLAKPSLPGDLLPAALSQPGALKPIVERIIPWPIP